MPAPYSPDISIRPITVKRPDGGRPGLPPQVGTTPSVDVGGRPYSGDISGLTVVAKRRQKSQVEPAGEKIPGKKDTSHLDELKKKAGAFFSPPEKPGDGSFQDRFHDLDTKKAIHNEVTQESQGRSFETYRQQARNIAENELQIHEAIDQLKNEIEVNALDEDRIGDQYRNVSGQIEAHNRPKT